MLYCIVLYQGALFCLKVPQASPSPGVCYIQKAGPEIETLSYPVIGIGVKLPVPLLVSTSRLLFTPEKRLRYRVAR